MNLILDNVIPNPLKDTQFNKQSFWNNPKIELICGDKYEIIANSGKGKTSFLDILYGKRRDFDGNFVIDNYSSKEFSSNLWSEYRKTKLSYVFQGLNLFPNLTAFENIQVKNRLTNSLSIEQIEDMAFRLNVHDQLQKQTAKMSFGQKQRIAIIRALSQPFKWLFMDEPFSHIDDKTSETIVNLVIERCESQNAGLIITSLDNRHFFECNHKIFL